MNTNAINKGTASATATVSHDVALPPAMGLLTPDLLMELCRMQIKGLDERVQLAFAGQKHRNELGTALSKLSTVLGGCKGGVAADDVAGKKNISDAYQEAINAVGADTDLGKRLTTEKNAFDHSAAGAPGSTTNDPRVDGSEMTTLMDAVQKLQSDVNRDGELEMIQLQSLMSQRAQHLQMCTNMVAGLGQSMMGIAQNVGK